MINSDYIFDGKTDENDNYIYDKINGVEIINYLEVSNIISYYKKIVEKELDQITFIINKQSIPKETIFEKSKCCKPYGCPFLGVTCFIDQVKTSKEGGGILELYSGGVSKDTRKQIEYFCNVYKKISEIPIEELEEECHIIQKETLEKDFVYIDNEVIKEKIEEIKCPVYYLDFESLELPLPRFKCENPFTQSLFQFSIHIEEKEGVCDYYKDNVQYIASSFKDERKDLTTLLVKTIDVEKGGSIIVYNDSFEKTRLEELAELFPQFAYELLKMRDMIIDLEKILHKGKTFYYYNSKMRGSYSIKKTLPCFSNLSYNDLNIKNGNMAMDAYIRMRNPEKYNTVIEDERENLHKYCGQDTYAMVEILRVLRKICS
jgi:hypothetical protein